MRYIFKFECVKGTFENRNKEKISYETLKLYTLMINEKQLNWEPKVDPSSEYEQAFISGGVRDRARKWVSAESIGEKSGVQVPVFDMISVPLKKLKDVIGLETFEEFAQAFSKDFFLHGVTPTYTENEYGNQELALLEITPGTVLDVLQQSQQS